MGHGTFGKHTATFCCPMSKVLVAAGEK